MTEPAAEFGSWGAPQVPVAIEYPLEVMDEIRAAAIDGLKQLARGGLEVAGVLFGTQPSNGIRVLTWRFISCEHALGPTLQLSERDRVELTRLLESSARDPNLKGLQPVGWFLSHTRSDVVLLPQDLEIFNAFFPQPWQVTLVLHPTPAGSARAGFFVREADGALKSDSSYQEFTVKPLHRAPRPADPPISVGTDRSSSPPKAEASIPAPLAATAEPERPDRVSPPLFGTMERRSVSWRWLWMFPVILALIIAGFLFKEKYLQGQSRSLAFHISEAGGTVQIEWDQNAAPIRDAHLGVIDIKDSGETKRYPLADDELRAGKMTYVRHGRDLELRMTVYPLSTTAVQEFVYFLDPGPPVPPAPSEVDQLRKERDRVEAEVKQLKEDLRKERAVRRRTR